MLAPHVQAFCAEDLCQQRRLSPHTIRRGRETCRFWLMLLRDHTGVEPSAGPMAEVDAPVVLRFLTSLEQERGNSVRSRTIRWLILDFRVVDLRML